MKHTSTGARAGHHGALIEPRPILIDINNAGEDKHSTVKHSDIERSAVKRTSSKRSTDAGSSGSCSTLGLGEAGNSAGHYTSRRQAESHSPEDFIQEATLVAAVTGRTHHYIRSPQEAQELLERHRSVIVLSNYDQPWHHSQGVELHRVDHIAGNIATELADRIGTVDPLRIAVIGAHGGAGTSLFSAAFAAGMSAVFQREALVIDRDPHSQGLSTVLGIENQPGWTSIDPSPECTEEDLLAQCPRIDDVAVLSRVAATVDMDSGNPAQELRIHQLAHIIRRAIMVVDCGRMHPGGSQWEQQWAHVTPDAVLIVGVLSVAGITALRDMSFCCEDSGITHPHCVIRRQASNATTLAMAAAVLEQPPAMVWEYDPQVPYDMDRGMLSMCKGKLARTARTLAGRIAAEWVEAAA